jgi:hypothetical protein
MYIYIHIYVYIYIYIYIYIYSTAQLNKYVWILEYRYTDKYNIYTLIL